ncbi:hypothetical protein ACO2Q3_08550 [Caulobacter sp. KR2-114]|uniref:hypothetical protein n=1 Tax=Caulobacter sp. KR2-114 TaxID=3400912 RepID=UPI003C0567E6
MAQWIVVYLIVAAAAGWTAWNLVLKGMVRRARAARAGVAARDLNCGDDCACGD